MKKTLIIIGIIITLLVLIIGVPILSLTRGLNEGKELPIGEIDPLSLEDGVYIGRYEGGRWTNEVAVTVQDRRIIDIEIIENLRYPREGVAEQLFDAVIHKQCIGVDAVSEATVSSKAYLKAIENALQ